MKKFLFFFTLAMLAIAGVAGCSNSNDPNEQMPTFTSVDELVEWCGKLPNAPSTMQKNKITTLSKLELDNNTGNYYSSNSDSFSMRCGFDEIVNVNSNNNETLYLGSIVKGKDLDKGLLSPISYGYSRQPITLTMNGANSIEVELPSLSKVTNAINELVAQKQPTPTCIDYQYKEVYSAEQSMMELGLNVGWGFFGASGMYGENSSYTKRSIFIYFKQIYYTVSMDGRDCRASRVFAGDVDVQKLSKETEKDNPLCVVSSIDYGRIIIVKITSTDSYDEMIGEIKAGFKSIGASYSAQKTSKLNSYDFSAQVIGGGVTSGVKPINGIDGVFQAINEGADYTKGNPGYPIAFRVRYLVDGSLARTGKEISYAADNWKQKIGRYRITFNKFELLTCDNWSGYINPRYEIGVRDENDNILVSSGTINETSEDIYKTLPINRSYTITISLTKYTDLKPYIVLYDISSFTTHLVTSTMWWHSSFVEWIKHYSGIEQANDCLTPAGTGWKSRLYYTITELP